MTTFTRARKPEQKEHRRAQLLNTARSMLQAGTPLPELSLNELARGADMTKSNVYRYFESREHVLIELLRDEWFAWFDSVKASWRAPRGAPLRHLARHLAHTLAQRPLLCQLTSALPSVLERNLSAEALIGFKRSTLAFFLEAGTFLSEKVPALGVAVGAQLLNDGAVFVTGLWPYAHTAPAIARAFASAPDLAALTRDFEADLTRFLYALAVDLTSTAS